MKISQFMIVTSRLCILLCALLFISSCSSSHLSVRSDFFNKSDLASVKINTPDPDKTAPIFGERIYVDWYTPYSVFKEAPLALHLRIKLKNGEEKDTVVPLESSFGSYMYSICGEDFNEKGGLLSYYIFLTSGEKVIASSRHKLWVDTIVIK